MKDKNRELATIDAVMLEHVRGGVGGPTPWTPQPQTPGNNPWAPQPQTPPTNPWIVIAI